ncbi:PREDICTED: ubiquitin carboxyl-terminal hydrolase 2-like, partial [Gekko japonicus]|uniref:Ubiquitin carboxyl-terminal hydrolase 2-like n=1 Tax=Gekko japonicus TaxID=146911 RepID=A0ABM1K380_GEKJA
MSQLSSTLKRYVGSSRYSDSSYSKSPSSYGAYSSYSSYTSNLSSSYPDKEKIGYKPGTTSSYLTSSHLRTSGATTSPSSSLNYDGGGRLLQRPDSGTRLSPSYVRVPVRPPGSGGLSGGGRQPPRAPRSTRTMLGRKKSSSHSDLARDLSGMHLSDSYRVDSTTRSPLIARNRTELSALQGFYQQPSRHSDYVKDYLESCNRKGGRSPVSLYGNNPDVITPTLRPISNCSLQQWERTESRTDITAREPS